MRYRPARIISAILFAAFVTAPISGGGASAFAALDSAYVQVLEVPIKETDSQLKQLEKDLKIIFTQYLNQDSNGTWRTNAKLIVAAGQDPATYSRIAAQFNKNPYTNPNIITPTFAFGSQEWGKCVLNTVAPGVFGGGVEGGVIAWLAKGKYAQVASWLIRVLGPRVALGAGVGLVSALAGGVAWCSTPWAS